MCAKNMYPDGTLLAEKATAIAELLGPTDFKASNGWLHRWKVQNNTKQRTIFPVNLEMLELIQMSHGGRDCHKYLWVTRLKIFGMSSRQDVSGKHSLIKE